MNDVNKFSCLNNLIDNRKYNIASRQIFHEWCCGNKGIQHQQQIAFPRVENTATI